MDPRHFRDLIGRFATGVTVITTEVDGLIHGMTANAFTSVSLDPILLLVCVDRTAHCHQQLMASHSFGVSLLSEQQQDLSDHFARSAKPGEISEGIEFTRGRTGIPLLLNSIGTFECAKHAVFDGGDHDIFVGRVEHGVLEDEDAKPLLFFGGQYERLE